MSFLYSGSLWSSLYCSVSSLCVGLYRWLVKVSWLGKLVSVFWWVELDFFGQLWAACILELRPVFLCFWRICLVCLALELVGPCVVLGFSVGMEVFDELLSINVPWSQGLDLSLLLLVTGLIFTVVSKLLLLYSTIDKTSTLKMKSFSTVRVTQRGSQSYMEKRRGRRELEVTQMR